ncbi:cyclin-A2-2-like [Humulus lupulus]|uniref:cyclin-A2-2-like n=1 Tax=Humulus lupulus TaxID=3486 RepID=UPI002B40D747|nr:cyclin-A2-2-like [Humulus lupulus]XP_062098585.1 cyclin-A2-2-like [Humulus lupulus]
MHCSWPGHANMNDENTNVANFEESGVRVTRARARALGTSGGVLPPLKPSQDQKRALRAKSKRANLDENKASMVAPASFQHKRRAVLKDVTNISCENSNFNNISACKVQTTRGDLKNVKVASNDSGDMLPVQEDAKTELAEELSRIKVAESEDFTKAVKLEKDEQVPNFRQYGVQNKTFPMQALTKCDGLRCSQRKEEDEVLDKTTASKEPEVVDIDSDVKDPQACSLYGPYIYNNRRITELERRPNINYMEELQKDITPNMRAILIDWLVEVSEEYKLVPDTLYLTINLIDRFLSHNYIEKQRLQLLGVSCMLIASKYEEICAPRAEEFCFITDSTYTRGEVLKMESEVLNLLHFHLSVPTTKTFLRRFILAAQSSYEVPCVELQFMANYLAELTLVDYSFLKFLPSLIAASAVFLARWTLNQSDHPWNSTLEHYTSYKTSELKDTVLAMEDLQLNTRGCPLNAIREKYRQHRFNCVATLSSTKSVVSLFSS